MVVDVNVNVNVNVNTTVDVDLDGSHAAARVALIGVPVEGVLVDGAPEATAFASTTTSTVELTFTSTVGALA